MVPLLWGDEPLTWDGVPLEVDPDEWDAMVARLIEICTRIRNHPLT
jgi:hypothetical protein